MRLVSTTIHSFPELQLLHFGRIARVPEILGNCSQTEICAPIWSAIQSLCYVLLCTYLNKRVWILRRAQVWLVLNCVFMVKKV
jgi:hypothetical protein